VSRKNKEESLLTRQNIILAALKEFETRGVAYTTLNHIAESADVSRGAIYWHFTSKAALYNEIRHLINVKLSNINQHHQTLLPGQSLQFMKRLVVDLLQATARLNVKKNKR